MQFTVEQRFPAGVDEVLALYTDPGFYPALDGLPRVSAPRSSTWLAPATSSPSRSGTGSPHRCLAPRWRIIDPAKLTWIDRTAYDLARATAATTLLPDHYPDRLTASASSTFTAGERGTVRRVTGRVEVHVPLVGGKVEGAIVDGLREHLADEAEVAASRLDDA